MISALPLDSISSSVSPVHSNFMPGIIVLVATSSMAARPWPEL